MTTRTDNVQRELDEEIRRIRRALDVFPDVKQVIFYVRLHRGGIHVRSVASDIKRDREVVRNGNGESNGEQ